MNFNEYDYSKLIENVNTANNEIKILEQEDMDLPIPAIKQLRDVTYHLVKALESKDNNSAEFIKQIKLAESHAIRSKYDIYELRIMWYLDNIKIFTEKLSSIKEAVEVIPDYINLLVEIDDIKTKFENNLNGHSISREQYYLNIKDEIKKLKKIKLIFETSLPIINKQYEERKEKDKKADRIAVITIVISVIALVLTFIGILIAS